MLKCRQCVYNEFGSPIFEHLHYLGFQNFPPTTYSNVCDRAFSSFMNENVWLTEMYYPEHFDPDCYIPRVSSRWEQHLPSTSMAEESHVSGKT